ncbi:cellulose binding domain-containing protein [Micromonospora sp. RL09-050-HVF-A]|uniref:cellulose binding domain-containing protein n=1 Tax=unclassified Micromonospora TaxID=2617518 RepID=UPI001C5D4792|nr:cellulose binding domain-containing protein [Micromonospora sp. RL09-050-HVF-A]MBW4700502.1 cellulose binding domain-containing protein [Micromonospora sp. RL09-050-HVF-A]
MRLRSSHLGAAAATLTLAAALDGVSVPTTVPASMSPRPGTAVPGSPPLGTAVPGSPPPSGAACTVRYSVYTWDTFLTSSITITNTGASAITSWRLTFPLPAGQRITTDWNAVYSPSSGTVTARGLDDHVILGPGASIAIGFVAEHTGDTGSPSSFTLNGTPCSLT